MSSYPEEYRARRPAGDEPLSPVALEARRQLALDRLTEAFASSAITMEDYEARAGKVQGARLPAEIDGAVADLPATVTPTQRGPARRGGRAKDEAAVSYRGPIDERLSGEESVACVMGDRVLQGDWLSGDKVGVFTVMGSTKIDLRDTALPPDRLKIDIFCLMGDVKVIVPEGLPVKMNAFPFMGDTKIGRDVQRRMERGEPHVEVNGFVLMGSLAVVTS